MARSMLEASIARKLAGNAAIPEASKSNQTLAARPRRVRCYHCGSQFEVSPHARSGPCAKCYKRLCLDDLVVQPTTAPLGESTSLTTCGMVVIEPAASAAVGTIRAMDGVEVGGRLHATIRARGPVVVNGDGELTGEVEAPEVVIKHGAIASAFFRTGRFAAQNQPETGR